MVMNMERIIGLGWPLILEDAFMAQRAPSPTVISPSTCIRPLHERVKLADLHERVRP